MSDEVEFSDESLRRIAEQKVNYRFSVQLHAGSFIGVNILLAALNLIFMPSYLWLLYPLLGWLVGLMVHLAAYLCYANGVYPLSKRGVIFHAVAYVFTNILLFATNYLSGLAYMWFLWCIGPWGIGLLIHAVIYQIYYSGSMEPKGETKSRKQKAIEKEMEKMKLKGDM